MAADFMLIIFKRVWLPQEQKTHVSWNWSRNVEREWVRPGKEFELGPPPLNHDAHVEAEDERDRDQLREVFRVNGHLLEQSGRGDDGGNALN